MGEEEIRLCLEQVLDKSIFWLGSKFQFFGKIIFKSLHFNCSFQKFSTCPISDDDDDDDANDDGDDEELKQIWMILMMIMMYSKRVERKQQNMLTDKYKFKFPEKSFKSRGVSQNRF